MKILVTGANGYLGLGIVKQLLDDGCEVIATDFNVDSIDKRAHIVKCDLFLVEDPFEYFGRPDVILHLAWKNGFVHDADSHLCDLPSHHLFLSKIFQSDIKRIAVMGSMHEVGFHEGSIDENTACNPKSLYGIAKNALRNDVEYLALKYRKPYQWLRGFYIVGNTSYGSSIFSKIVKAVEEGKNTFPFTQGLNQFDFLDYNQFCLQTVATVEQENITGIINICSGYPVRLGERVERFIKENNYPIVLEYGAYPDRTYDSKAIWGNDSKISKIIYERSKRV